MGKGPKTNEMSAPATGPAPAFSTTQNGAPDTSTVLVPLTTAVGTRLKATQTKATGPLHGHLIVAGATGVPQRFYQRFATFCAAQGIEVWTLDYRGIGLSKPADLRGSSIS